jgi:hypothetical protein
VICVGVLYAVTARQASWGGPLWWPAAVGAAGLPALAAIGFAAGAWFPSRFMTPLVSVTAFFCRAQRAVRAWRYVALASFADHHGSLDVGPDPGVATFYPYLPDLSIAQLIFAAGVAAAVIGALGVALAALSTAGLGTHLAGGVSGVVCNLAGAVGLGLLSAAAFGGGLAWVGPAGYLVVAAYALYGQWHGGGPSAPWIWPARPQADLGAWLCAAVVFAAGMTVITVRGARNST